MKNKNKKTSRQAVDEIYPAVENLKIEIKKAVRSCLNRLAIWLYKITREDDGQTSMQILSGLRIFGSHMIPKGECFVGTGERDALRKAFINEEIIKKEDKE